MLAVNLLDVIGKDTRLKRVASTNGGEYAGPCPLCGGTDRLRVWPEQDGGRWWCRQCGKGGDLIAYQVEAGRIDKAEAYRLRHGDGATVAARPVAQPVQPVAPQVASPPGDTWQARAWDLVAEAQAALWADVGARALAWLHKRGLSDDTIRAGGLGYVARDRYEERAAWGLDPQTDPKTGKPKRVWIPRGVVMPWPIGRDLWRVNIRRPVKPGETPKCYSPPGFGPGLYEADRLRPDRPAILVEGELDALTLLQEAGDLVSPVATGGTGGGRRARWVGKLAQCPAVLVSFDADEAGEQARQWWLGILQNGAYWRPFWGDSNAMLQGGADVRAWVEAGLEQTRTGASNDH